MERFNFLPIKERNDWHHSFTIHCVGYRNRAGGDSMTYYVPSAFFSSLTIDGEEITWRGKGGNVGVIPVYNSEDAARLAHPNSSVIEIDELFKA